MEMETSQPPVPSPEKEAPPAAEDPPPVRVAVEPLSQPDDSTPEEVDYTFSADGVINLLITYEYLVEQELQARKERCPHEPALAFAKRRMLRERRSLLAYLPTARPLKNHPAIFMHEDEPDWQDYEEPQEHPDNTQDRPLD